MNPGTRKNRLWRKIKKVLQIGILGAVNGIRLREWYAAAHPGLEEVCRECSTPIWDVPYIGSRETEDLFRRAGADLGLSLGNPFIPERIFSIPKYGMLNLHGERLPEYQNAQSVIWPIYNNETTTGLTIHQVVRSIDGGAILYREEFPIQFGPTLSDTLGRTLPETRKRTVAAISYACEHFFELLEKRVEQVGARHYTTPSYWQFLRMERNNRSLYRASAQSVQ